MTAISTTQELRSATYPSGELAASSADAGATPPLPDPLSALLLSGDPGAELAALAVQSGERQETTAQTSRDIEQKIEVDEDGQQVAAMEKKADDIRSAGILEGAGMAAEGVASVVGGCLDSRQLGDAIGHGGKAADGAATLGAAFPKAEAARDDANAAAAKSAADQARGAAEDLHDAKKSASDFISAALDFYREYTSAQASAQSAALHRA
jgi:hypothetical protein